MEPSSLLEAFDREILSLLAYSSFVPRVSRLSFMRLLGITLSRAFLFCRSSPSVTHLFFADDNILFCKANPDECQELKLILQKYEDASGQKINTEKSSILFSTNTIQNTKDAIFSILGLVNDSRHTKYLGLPSFIGR